jgi:hypothetical protein
MAYMPSAAPSETKQPKPRSTYRSSICMQWIGHPRPTQRTCQTGPYPLAKLRRNPKSP